MPVKKRTRSADQTTRPGKRVPQEPAAEEEDRLVPGNRELRVIAGVPGERGEADGRLHAPSALAVAAGTAAYVADFNNHRVQRFSITTGEDGTSTSWAEPSTVAGGKGFGTGSGALGLPAAICLLPRSEALGRPADVLYVASWASHSVHRFVVGGVRACSSSTPPREEATGGESSVALLHGFNQRFRSPSGVAVTEDERCVYVSDTANHRVARWKQGAKSTTDIAGTWGRPGAGENQLDHPGQLRVVGTKQQDLLVCDGNNARILLLRNAATAKLPARVVFLTAAERIQGFGLSPFTGRLAVCCEKEVLVWPAHVVRQRLAAGASTTKEEEAAAVRVSGGALRSPKAVAFFPQPKATSSGPEGEPEARHCEALAVADDSQDCVFAVTL